MIWIKYEKTTHYANIPHLLGVAVLGGIITSSLINPGSSGPNTYVIKSL